MNKNCKLKYITIILKICLLIIAITSLYLGISRMYLGGVGVTPIIDNSLRFYAGTLFAIGPLAIWTAMNIKKQITFIYFIAFFVFMGGIGRLVSISSVGLPSNIFLFYLTIEFLIPTIMIISKIYLDKHLVD